jgi:hypothetical protein
MRMPKTCVWVGVGKLTMLGSELVFIPRQSSCFLWPKNLTMHLYVRSVQNLNSTVTWLQKYITTEPCVQIGCMSNRWEAEFVNGIFCIYSFCGGHDEISPKTLFVPEGAIGPDLLFQQTGRVSDSRNSQIANFLLPYYRPSERWESCLPKWCLGLLEFCHTRFCEQNHVLMHMCAQYHLFHTHGHKVFTDSQMSRTKYNYYINIVSKD